MRRFLGLRWLTIALIMLGALVNFLSRQTLSIAAPTVISSLQAGFWGRSSYLDTVPSLAGDTIFVPEDFDKLTNLESAKAWSQIIFQVGLGLAGVASAIR